MFTDYDIEIFIPTYNRAGYLKKCLNAVNNLDGPRPLITVLDNNSDDETDLIISSFQKKFEIRHVKRPFNAGMFTNLNSIPSLVRTEFFSFITDDDEYFSNFLTVHSSMMADETDFTISNCNILTIDGKLEPGSIKKWDKEVDSNNEFIINSILHGFPVVTHMVFRKSVLEDFYFDPELGAPSDAYLLLKLMSKYRYKVSETTTGNWNFHVGSASKKQKKFEIRVMQLKVLRRQFQFLQQQNTNSFARKIIQKRIIRYKLSMLKSVLCLRNSLEEARLIWKI